MLIFTIFGKFESVVLSSSSASLTSAGFSLGFCGLGVLVVVVVVVVVVVTGCGFIVIGGFEATGSLGFWFIGFCGLTFGGFVGAGFGGLTFFGGFVGAGFGGLTFFGGFVGAGFGGLTFFGGFVGAGFGGCVVDFFFFLGAVLMLPKVTRGLCISNPSYLQSSLDWSNEALFKLTQFFIFNAFSNGSLHIAVQSVLSSSVCPFWHSHSQIFSAVSETGQIVYKIAIFYLIVQIFYSELNLIFLFNFAKRISKTIFSSDEKAIEWV